MKLSLCFLIVPIFLTTVVLALPIEHNGHRTPPRPARSDESIDGGIEHLLNPLPPGLPLPVDLHPENPGQTPSSPHNGSSRRRGSAPPQMLGNSPAYGEHVHHQMFLA